MTNDLRFQAALGPQPGGAVALRFGFIGEPPVPPRISLRSWFGSPWRAAEPGAPVLVAAGWREAQVLAGGVAAPWSGCAAIGSGLGASWAFTHLTLKRLSAPWRMNVVQRRELLSPWQQAIVVRRPLAAAWATGAAAGRWMLSEWQCGDFRQAVTEATWAGGLPAAIRRGSGFGRVTPYAGLLAAPWQIGAPVASFGGPWVLPAPVLPPAVRPCYLPGAGDAVDLRFEDALALAPLVHLLFGCRHRALVRVPIRRVYMVTNTTSLVRVDSGDTIPVLGLSLSLDVDSKDIGFSASLPGSALALIEPGEAGDAVELLATVNGYGFRLIAESISRERSFGQSSIRVQGRGRSALLDAPYATLATFANAGSAMTSQQLLEAALPDPWTADWGLTAWLVPAGVWSHQGTPASAAAAIAAAGGGYLQPHLTARTLRVLPRYPVAPWDWGGVTPDVDLPGAVTVRESIEWVDKPRYNAVYVSGVAGGGLYLVKRAGSAGDVVAQMVTDPLATHVDAGRQRGIPVLADTGRQAKVVLRLPVLPESGIILPGAFVRYVDAGVTRKGLVRSLSVDAGFPETWQTIGVETHVD